MPSTISLIKRLRADYPGLTFAVGDDYHWSARELTVYYLPGSSNEAIVNLLHESSHGLLEHQDYQKDVELLAKEVDAWQYASTVLAPRYELVIDPEYVDEALESYREWLHARSTCPTCQQTGAQTTRNSYQCLNCLAQWQVNETRDGCVRLLRRMIR